MATTNYVNPTALMPQVGFKPEGFLGGHMLANQDRMFKQQMAQQQAMQNLDLLRQQIEMQDFQKDAPLRDAKRDLGIATAQAQTPIQGDLAQGAVADARFKSQTLPTRVGDAQFKSRQTKQDYAQEVMGGGLNSILNSGLPPQEMMMKWTQEILPVIEQVTGEPVPDQFKNLTPSQMQLLSNRLTETTKFRQDMTKQRDKSDADYRRAIDVANINANTQRDVANRRGDQTTAAEARLQQLERYKQARLEQLMTQRLSTMPNGTRQRGIDEQTFLNLQNQAEIDANQLFFGGNPMGRAEGTAVGDAGKKDNTKLQFEMLTAQPAPRDPAEREVNKLYINPQGGYVRWMGSGWKAESLQGQQ